MEATHFAYTLEKAGLEIGSEEAKEVMDQVSVTNEGKIDISNLLLSTTGGSKSVFEMDAKSKPKKTVQEKEKRESSLADYYQLASKNSKTQSLIPQSPLSAKHEARQAEKKSVGKSFKNQSSTASLLEEWMPHSSYVQRARRKRRQNGNSIQMGKESIASTIHSEGLERQDAEDAESLIEASEMSTKEMCFDHQPHLKNSFSLKGMSENDNGRHGDGDEYLEKQPHLADHITFVTDGSEEAEMFQHGIRTFKKAHDISEDFMKFEEEAKNGNGEEIKGSREGSQAHQSSTDFMAFEMENTKRIQAGDSSWKQRILSGEGKRKVVVDPEEQERLRQIRERQEQEEIRTTKRQQVHTLLGDLDAGRIQERQFKSKMERLGANVSDGKIDKMMASFLSGEKSIHSMALKMTDEVTMDDEFVPVMSKAKDAHQATIKNLFVDEDREAKEGRVVIQPHLNSRVSHVVAWEEQEGRTVQIGDDVDTPRHSKRIVKGSSQNRDAIGGLMQWENDETPSTLKQTGKSKSLNQELQGDAVNGLMQWEQERSVREELTLRKTQSMESSNRRMSSSSSSIGIGEQQVEQERPTTGRRVWRNANASSIFFDEV